MNFAVTAVLAFVAIAHAGEVTKITHGLTGKRVLKQGTMVVTSCLQVVVIALHFQAMTPFPTSVSLLTAAIKTIRMMCVILKVTVTHAAT